MEVPFLEFVLVSAVTMGLSHTIAREKIFEPLRNACGGMSTWRGYLLSCPYCASHWLAFVLVPLTGAYGIHVAPRWPVISPILDWFLSSILVTVMRAGDTLGAVAPEVRLRAYALDCAGCRLPEMASRNPLSHVPPDEFIKARDALVRKLREGGESEEANRIASLRRPSAALWVTNQLGAKAAKDVDALIDSSRRAQRAQLHGGGEDLRAAMHDQRQALRRLTAEAQELVAGIGATMTPELQRRIQDSVQTAATTDPDALRNGTLEQELSAAGFGALLSGRAAVTAKAQANKAGFEDRKDRHKRLLAEKRERLHRQREGQRAIQTARRLAARAEQLERVAREAQLAADRAKEKSREARRAADEGAARLAQIRGSTT